MADKKKKKISEMTSAEIKKKYPKFEDLPKNLLSGMPQDESDSFLRKLITKYGPVENLVKLLDKVTGREKRTKPILPEGLMKRVDKGIPLTHSPVKSPARRVPTKEELGKASGGLVGGQKKLDKNKDGKISGADFKMMRKNYAYGGRVAKMSAEKS